AAALAETLARTCGRLSLLATSREPLGIAGEVVWRVPCLSVPEEQGSVGTQPLDASEAVRLFIDRARAARPNFAITNDNAPAVSAICSRLDGIPLAIELAAARARMMSAERIAEALADRFHLLSGSTRSAIPRQATLRASVDWSNQFRTNEGSLPPWLRCTPYPLPRSRWCRTERRFGRACAWCDRRPFVRPETGDAA
ncbi:MAG: hypothetical protein ABR972_15800, partial [Acidimicrobiales bacterium]